MFGFLKELVVSVRQFVVWMWERKRKKSLKEDLDSSEKIISLLDILREDTNADRALVYQFHNGEYFYTGHSIDKMSNTHESVSKGISREQVHSSGIFTAPYRNMMRGLLSNEVFGYDDVEEIEDYNTKIFLMERGVNSVIMSLLRDKGDRPVGLVSLEFVKDSMYDEDVNEKSILSASKSIYDLLIYGRIKTK